MLAYRSNLDFNNYFGGIVMQKLNRAFLIVLAIGFSSATFSCSGPQKIQPVPVTKTSPEITKEMHLKSGRIIDCDMIWEGYEGQILCKKSEGIAAYSAGDVDLLRTFGERSGKEIGKRYEEVVKQRERMSKKIIVTPEQERWMNRQKLEAQKRPESLGSSEDLTALRDVDLINISSYIQDKVLKVSFLYKNRDKDELIYWRAGTVSCSCEVYEIMGSPFDEQKGEQIAQIDKQLKSFSQDFYIDIPIRYLNKDKWGIIECSVNTGYKKLAASNTFLLK
jgi:hypothetical protein